jgi:hypothetical protein
MFGCRGRLTAARHATSDPCDLRLIADGAQGRIDYRMMTPQLAEAVRAQAGVTRSDLAALGALKSVSLTSTGPSGAEYYRTDFEHGALEWAFSVNAQGLIDNARYRRPASPAP